VLVGHSMGGLVAVRAFADPDLRARHADTLRQIEGLVLISPSDVMLTQVGASIKERVELSGFKANLGDGLGILREKAAQFLAESFYSSVCLSREDVDQVAHIITDHAHRRAWQAMLLEALPFDEKTMQPILDEMQRMETWYKNVTVPVRLIWGNCDATLPVALGYKMAAQLPNAKLTVLPDCKHAPALECPDLCARLMREAEVAIRSEPKTGAEQKVGRVSDQRVFIAKK
jgi:pimeloyl-ACP methyl ester carboxylesterase